MAEWLYEILAKEEIYNPIIIGQSMGGYLAQMYMELYPDKIKGFISIDSAPLQKSYMTAMEIWLLERAEPLYKICLLYTSPSPRDLSTSRMPSSA